jgi:hypothetical protein
MSKTAIALASILFLICGFVNIDADAAGISHAAAKAGATKAAIAWLKLIDAGDYAASWNAAGSFFKSGLTHAQIRQVPDDNARRAGRPVRRHPVSIVIRA